MSTQSLFIYDGECPFCNHFAQLLLIKKSIPSLQILDGRKELAKLTSLYKQGYDLNNGAILINNGTIMHGAEAINWICSKIQDPNDSLLELLKMIFTSNKRTKFIFPLLIWGRRVALTLKGKVWKPVSETTEFY
tara:strand:+ start:3319 stop:3720 length:402 start_codon:yes stop_codon:yes gene_type:complete